MNQLHTSGETQRYFLPPDEVTFPVTASPHQMYSEDRYFRNPYPRSTFSNQTYPSNAYLPKAAASSAHHPNAFLQDANQSYLYGQYRNRTMYALNGYETNAALPTFQVPSAYQTNVPSADVRQLNTYPQPSTQPRPCQEDTYSRSSTHPQHPTSLNTVNLHQQQSQFHASCTSPTPPYQGTSRRQIPRLQSSYSSSSANSDTRSRYYCSICDGSFGRESDLDRHLRTMHGNTVYRCSDCGGRNRREDNMRKHCRKDHHHAQGQERYSVING